MTTSYWTGKKRSPEDRLKMRLAKLGKYCGEMNPSWKGGKPSCADCNKKLTTYNRIRCLSCAIKNRSGEKHYEWKGDNVGYRGLHRWVDKNLGKPAKCENCGVIKKGLRQMHWANKSKEYKRELSDWVRLCVKCHWALDKKERIQKKVIHTWLDKK